jgi:hypothetical protein
MRECHSPFTHSNTSARWVTNGTFSDYFTTGCKIETGFIVMLIEHDDNLETKAIKTSYSVTAGTAYVTFNLLLSCSRI